MPAKSEAQQRLMGMALAAKRGKGHFSKKIHEVANSMSEKQLRDFAKTKHENLPEKTAEIIKWAVGNAPALVPSSAVSGGGGQIVNNLRPYYGPTSGPSVVNMGARKWIPRVLGKTVTRAMPYVGGAFAINDAINASDRAAHGDNVGAWIDRVGGLGGAVGMIPHPYAMYGGNAVSVLTGGINAYRDRNGAYGGMGVNNIAPAQPATNTAPEQQSPAGQFNPTAGSSGDWESQDGFNSFGGAQFAPTDGGSGDWENTTTPIQQTEVSNAAAPFYGPVNLPHTEAIPGGHSNRPAPFYGPVNLPHTEAIPDALHQRNNMLKTSALKEALKYKFRKTDV